MDLSGITMLLSLANLVYSASLCGVCPPGTFVARKCSETTSRICKPCPSGTYSNLPNFSEKCRTCTICTGKRLEFRACNKTHDTTCKCASGHFFNSDLLVCLPCTPCEVGSGVVKNCSDRSDTVCERCKPETFSSVRSFTEPCKKCRTCHAGEIVQTNCTREQDRGCDVSMKTKLIEQNKSKLTTAVQENQNHRLKNKTFTENDVSGSTGSTAISTKNTGTQQELEISAEDETERIVLYVLISIVVLAVIIFLLVCYCCLKKKCAGETKTSHHLSENPEKETPKEFIKKTVVVHIPEDSKVHQTIPVDKYPANQQLQNVGYGLYDELNSQLNPAGKWKKLAAALNYSPLKVANFDLKSQTATSDLLSDWSHQRGATLGALYDVFRSLKLDTEATIVAKYIVQTPGECV